MATSAAPPASPPLGNGLEETLSEEDLGGVGHADGPESQGAYAGEDYGASEQGAYGDENFDPSYQRDGDVVAALDPDAALSITESPPPEHEGPGRGVAGGEWASQDPFEPPDEVARKVLDEETEERRRDDDAIRDDVVDVLTEALPDISDLDVTVERGEVTLAGTVPERPDRLAAYRLTARVPGVVEVVDRLRIVQA